VAEYLELLRDIDPNGIAYVDETGMDSFLYREYVYAKRGENVIGDVPGKKYQRVGIVAAQIGKRVISPIQFDGTMDSKLFEFWFDNFLMCELPANSVIVMDNAAFHRKKRLLSLAQDKGHRVIFLPPYSPELNPIEHFWAWLKRKLKNILSQHISFNDALCYCFNDI
jgi:transposase